MLTSAQPVSGSCGEGQKIHGARLHLIQGSAGPAKLLQAGAAASEASAGSVSARQLASDASGAGSLTVGSCGRQHGRAAPVTNAVVVLILFPLDFAAGCHSAGAAVSCLGLGAARSSRV